MQTHSMTYGKGVSHAGNLTNQEDTTEREEFEVPGLANDEDPYRTESDDEGTVKVEDPHRTKSGEGGPAEVEDPYRTESDDE